MDTHVSNFNDTLNPLFSCQHIVGVGKSDYVSDNVLMNDYHSDSTYWVTKWSYLLLLSILVWNVHLATQYDSMELKWNLTWTMIVYFSCEIHTLNSSMIAIFWSYMCNCSRHTNFYHFSCIYVTFHSKKRFQKKKGKRLYAWTQTLCKVKNCCPS